MTRRFTDYLLLGFKGMGMGAADIVPGVSGGTIAFISGIYEELIESIRSIGPGSMKLLFSRGFSAFWKHIHGNFLLSVATGILISVLTLARLLEYLLIHQAILIWSFFFGLVIASAVFVARNIKQWKVSYVFSLLGGIAAACFVTHITPAETTEEIWFIFISGALAICAMILPGISGSFILLLLGKYEYILNALNEGYFGTIAVLTAGAVAGLIGFSNFLSWLLRKYHHLTIAMLAGFMVGSLNKIWPWKIAAGAPEITGSAGKQMLRNALPELYGSVTGKDPMLLQAIICMSAGIILILIMEGLGKKRS